MAIKIPADARIADDERLTTIAIVNALAKHVEADDGLKALVKKSLKEQGASFAQSELAIARFSAGERSTISPAKLWKLVVAGKLNEKQALECMTVSRKPLEQHLAGKEIDAISETKATEGSLTVEMKDAAAIDAADLADVLVEVVKKQLAGERAPSTKKAA